MDSLTLSSLLLAGVGLSWFVTALTRQAALRAQIIDHPNERSSHTRPTPRSGGIGIVVPFLGLLTLFYAAGGLPFELLQAMVGAGLLVAGVGLLDDVGGVPAGRRLIAHLVAAAWIVRCIWPLPPLSAFGATYELGLWAVPIALLMVVWTINLFNFMDGIDGIAGVEAIFVGAGGALAWWLARPDAEVAPALLFAACTAGFLAWNFPPARIFMGDVGSGFLGLAIALMALWSAREAPHVVWSWLILMGCFMVDATTTLVRRVNRGERFSQAHRCHAYQYASRRHQSHRFVTLSVLAINLLWLLPLSCGVALGGIDGLTGLVVAYVPLVWMAFRYKAGDRAAQESTA